MAYNKKTSDEKNEELLQEYVRQRAQDSEQIDKLNKTITSLERQLKVYKNISKPIVFIQEGSIGEEELELLKQTFTAIVYRQGFIAPQVVQLKNFNN